MFSGSAKKLGIGSLLLVAMMWMPTPAAAMPMYDFSLLNPGGVEGLINGGDTSWTDGIVTVTGFADFGGGFVPAPLWVRNSGNIDNGLGVCSEGTDRCTSGGGDVNELSMGTIAEAILLTLAPGYVWDGLWLSSLDENGDPGGVENGQVFENFNQAGNFQNFGFGIFGGAVEGELPDGFWKNTAMQLVFIPGQIFGATGANNDYLVWGVDIAQELRVPEPATLSLFGLGLIGIGAQMRRRRRKA